MVWFVGGCYLAFLCMMLGFLIVAMASGKGSEPKVWLRTGGFIAIMSGMVLLPLLPGFQRRDPTFAGLDLLELRTLVRWLLRGDPLGRRLGQTRCHRCDHVRGASEICPECGARALSNDGRRRLEEVGPSPVKTFFVYGFSYGGFCFAVWFIVWLLEMVLA